LSFFVINRRETGEQRERGKGGEVGGVGEIKAKRARGIGTKTERAR